MEKLQVKTSWGADVVPLVVVPLVNEVDVEPDPPQLIAPMAMIKSEAELTA